MSTSNAARAHAAVRERTKTRIGDGTKVTTEAFAKFSYAERAELARVNFDAYRTLADAEADR